MITVTRARRGLTRAVLAGLCVSTLGVLPAQATQAPTALKTYEMGEVWIADDERGIAGWEIQGSTSFRARLTSEGVGVAGKMIAFSSDGLALCNGVTDSSGVAECWGGTGFGPGVAAALATDTYQATFDGDEQFLPSTASGPVIRFS